MTTATRTRITKPVTPAIADRAAFEELVGTLAREIILQRATKIAMDDEITVIRQKYEPQLAECDAHIADGMKLAQEYCDANPDMFDGKRSIDTTHAAVGYRTGMPKLKTLRGWTWDRVLESLASLPGKMRDYIRTKPEVDKAKIIAEADDIGADCLRKFGMQLVQDETFFIDPKLEDLEARLKS